MTQQQKILAIMCKEPDKWFFPYEFMMPELGHLFVGYKAPTRIAEMHKKYPNMFLRKSEDKYMQRRLNMPEYDTWYHDLDSDLQSVVYNNLGNPVTKPKQPAGKAISWLEKEDL